MNIRLFLTLTALTAAGLFAKAETVRHYLDSLTSLTDSTLTVEFPDDRLSSQAIEIRASLPDAEIGAPLVAFGILWDIDSVSGSYYQAMLRPTGYRDEDNVVDRRYVDLTVSRHSERGDSIIHSSRHREGFGLERKENTLGVDIDRTTGKVLIYGGNEQPESLFEMTCPLPLHRGMAIRAEGKAEISLAMSEYQTPADAGLQTPWTLDELEAHFRKSAAPQGFYRYLDRKNDPRYCRMGGNYIIALTASTDGGYDIIYISGARQNESEWQCGMLKGHLYPTIFRNHFDLKWFDSEMNALSEECSADLEQDAILTINFPLLKSSFRFALQPRDN